MTKTTWQRKQYGQHHLNKVRIQSQDGSLASGDVMRPQLWIMKLAGFELDLSFVISKIKLT